MKIHTGFKEFVETEAPRLIEQIPVITITDGEASIEEYQPYYIHDPDTGENFAVIDTTGSINSLSDTDAKILLTKTEVIIEKNNFETRTYRFDQIKDFQLDRDKINGWLSIMQKFVAIVIYPFALTGSFIFRVIQVLIYALIGMAFASMTNSARSYLELIRLSVFALGPGIILKTIFTILEINFPLMSLILICVTLGYVYLGVRSASEVTADEDLDSSPEY